MTIYNYSKQVNVRKLYKEFSTNDFNIFSITFDPRTNALIVDTDVLETKDPSDVVRNHIYTVDKPINWQSEWTKALTIDDKLLVISKCLEFVDLTEDERASGIILQ